MPQILLMGATGLVGAQVFDLLRSKQAHKLHAVVRKAPNSGAEYLPHVLADSEQDAELKIRLLERLSGQRLDVFICCLGTTIKDAGSKEAFLAVDRELFLRMARIAKELGARKAIVVSSVGADRASSQFYLRVKGEVEDLLEALKFKQLIILRPGLLIGERKQRRSGEALAQKVQPWFDGLLIGRWRRYRSIRSDVVAKAIANAANADVVPSTKVIVWEHDDIRRSSAA
jgi:uncharacterized protein YbjT (DUF2867 family)